MSERQQAEMLLNNVPEQSLHIVIALMRKLTGYAPQFYEDMKQLEDHIFVFYVLCVLRRAAGVFIRPEGDEPAGENGDPPCKTRNHGSF